MNEWASRSSSYEDEDDDDDVGAIVLHREIAHIKSQRMGINDKKKEKKNEEGVEVAEAGKVGVGEAEIKKRKRNETKRTKLTGNWQAKAEKAEKGERVFKIGMKCHAKVSLLGTLLPLPLSLSLTSAAAPQQCATVNFSDIHDVAPAKRVKMFHCLCRRQHMPIIYAI